MEKQLEHLEGAALEAVRAKLKATQGPCVIKLGVDVHSAQSVVVAQWDHATPRAAQRFLPQAFVPWVEGLLRVGHEVHVVYEACGFG